MKPSDVRRHHYLDKLIHNKMSDQTGILKSRANETSQPDTHQPQNLAEETLSVSKPEHSRDLHNEQSILTLNPAQHLRQKDRSEQAKVVNLN